MSTGVTARLLVLGGASLEGDRGPIAGRTAQRRRLALLAILAASGRGVSRDKLIGYLWEEADTDRARRVLSEAIYVIRKALGEDSVVTVGDEVRLNTQVVWSDVGAFSEALDAGQLEQAVELYRGPFLDGFFIGDALEFEQWAQRERDRLARAYAHALQQLAQRAQEAGDYRGATRWWRLLSEYDRYAAAPMLGLMRALDAIGDRAAAIQEARSHATRMKADLDADPDAQVEAFAEALKASAASTVLPDRVLERTAGIEDRGSRIEETTAVATNRVYVNPPRRFKKRYAFGALTVLAAAVVAIVLVTTGRNERMGVGRSASLVAVLPFKVDGEAVELRDGLAQLISGNLDGAGDLRAVNPHVLLSAADRFGTEQISPTQAARFANNYAARYMVLGSVLQTGNLLTLDASMYNVAPPYQRIASATGRGQRDSVLVLVDRLTQQLLLSGFGDGAGQQLIGSAARLTTSYKALKAFWNGEHHFRAGRNDLASDHFASAVSEDPQFALAHYRLSAAREWNFEFLEARRSAEKARELSAGLPETEQLTVSAWNDFLAGNAVQAHDRYNQIRTRLPNNVEALSGLAEVLVHYNPIAGKPVSEAKPVFERALALAPAYGEVRFHLMEFAAREKNQARFDSLYNDLPAANPQRLSWKVVRAFTFGSAAEQARVLNELDTASNRTIGIAAGRLAAHTHNFSGAVRVAQKLLAQAESPDWKAGAHLLLAQLALGQNDWPAAQRSLALAEPIDEDWTRELSAIFLLHPAARATREQILAEREKLELWQPGRRTPSTSFFFLGHVNIHAELRLYLLGLLSALGQDNDAAQGYRTELLRAGRTAETQQLAVSLARGLQGHIARAQGQNGAAVEHLVNAQIAAHPEVLALSPFYARSYDRLVLAQLTGDARWKKSLSEGLDFAWASAFSLL